MIPCHVPLVLALSTGSGWSRQRSALTDGPSRASQAETQRLCLSSSRRLAWDAAAGRRKGTAVNQPPATSDLHVAGFQPLIAPNELLAELPLGESRAATARSPRHAVRRLLAGADDPPLVIVSPCSMHGAAPQVDYAARPA